MASFLISTLVLFGAVWFLLLRPQRRRYVEHQALLSSLEEGDDIITAGGLYGRVEALDDDVVMLEIAPATTVRVARRAIARNLRRERAEAHEAETREIEAGNAETGDDDAGPMG